MSSEQQLWNRVRGAVGHRVRMKRIESPITPGLPDVNYLFKGGEEGWFEMKYREWVPARPTTSVFSSRGLSEEQIGELRARIKLGGRAWIVAGVDRAVFLIHGKYAEVFNAWNMRQLMARASWKGGSQIAPAAWGDFLQILRGKIH
jgi:hypothetical protein